MFPDTFFASPSDEALTNDLTLMKAAGFNMVRLFLVYQREASCTVVCPCASCLRALPDMWQQPLMLCELGKTLSALPVLVANKQTGAGL